MDWFSIFIVRYGGAAVFLFSFVENIGAPFPAQRRCHCLCRAGIRLTDQI